MSKDFDELKGIDYSQLRKHKRYEINIACKLESVNNPENSFGSLLTTISAGGLSFINHEILTKGDLYNVSFKMPNGSDVNKQLEVRWFDKDIITVNHDGKEYSGFEHGCKFVVVKSERGVSTMESARININNKGSSINETVDKKEPEPEPEPEVFENCSYHLEFLRDGSNIIRHGYASQKSNQHIVFQTLQPLRQNEMIDSNLIVVDEEVLKEERHKLLVKEMNKDGLQYTIKAMKME